MKHLKTFETEKPKYWTKEELHELENKTERKPNGEENSQSQSEV